MNTIRRKPKTKKEKEKDFYQTNPTMPIALIDWCKDMNISINSKVLDPCCGKGVITRGLFRYFLNVKSFDKFEGRKKGNFLNHNKTYDLIVMNPPYSNSNIYKFIDHARKYSDIVICLLPLNVSNYNIFHREYENVKEFVGKIQMAPKMFLGDTTEFKAGGTAQYCWYIWDKNNNTDYSKTWYYDLRDYQGLL